MTATNTPTSEPKQRTRATKQQVAELRESLWRAGLRPEFSERGPASGITAVAAGTPTQSVVETLMRTRAEMFDHTLARRRSGIHASNRTKGCSTPVEPPPHRSRQAGSRR